MIGLFPEPYPDELLYSVCARFSDRVQYPGSSSVMRELFGTKNAVAVVDLPSRLGHLVAVLPPGHRYTVERLIDDHTLLPFYSPFCPPERINFVREDMLGTNGSRIHGRLGILVSKRPEWLQFCPLCVQSDLRQFGEPYWHRLHQVPGVEVCPVHAVFLEASDVPVGTRRKSCELLTAFRAIRATPPRSLSLTEPTHQALLKIAQDAAWLLNQPHFTPGLDAVRYRYRILLAFQGLATYRGNVYAKELGTAFKNFYTSEFLQRLRCCFDEQSHHHWLIRLTHSKANKAQSPLHHLLLIHFLGYSAAEFFQLESEFHPFGVGPWPCLNQASDHFGQRKITTCRINYSEKHRQRQPVGTFSCTCGFVYCRIGPDESDNDRLRIDLLKSYGSVWESVLKTLWNDSTVSIKEIARRLNVTRATVKRMAARLDLPFPRKGSRFSPVSVPVKSRSEIDPIIASSTLETYRLEWKEVRTAHPEAGRQLLQTQFGRLHIWLTRHDPEWLEAHLPPRCCRKGIKPKQPLRVDWPKRDAQLASEVRDAAQCLLKAPGRPIWITKTAIGRNLGKKTLITKEISQLPLTAMALASVVETHQEYALRRLNWATECFHSEGICPKRWQLLSRASLKPKTVALPAVKEAIEAALASLELLTSS